MVEKRVRVLLVEDNPGDARLVREMLIEPGVGSFDTVWVGRLSDAMEQLSQGPFDVILLDLSLPDSTGMETIRKVREFSAEPIVVLTGLDDAEVGLKAVKEGCQDYLVKGEGGGDLLVRTLLYAIERKKTEEALRHSQDRYRELVRITPDAILIYSSDGILFANPAAAVLFRAENYKALLGHRFKELIAPTDGAGLRDRVLAMVTAGRQEIERVDCTMCRLDGTEFDAEITAVPMSYQDREAVELIIRDVTTQKEIQRSQRLAATVFQTSGEAMMVVDEDLKIVAINPAFSQITGFSAKEALGETPSLLASGRHDKAFYEKMWKTLERDRHWRGELWNRRKNGELYVQKATISEIVDEDDRISNYVCVFSDVTDERLEAEEDRFRATHDALTGLPNRTLLADRINHARSSAVREKEVVAILFVDLDGFKPVNDTLGHLAGDTILQEVAERLKSSVREGDTVARLGGDEFIVVSNVVHGKGDAEKISDKIIENIARPFIYEGEEVRIGCSIGISVCPIHGREVEELIMAADKAMYSAKKAGRGRWVFYDPAKHEEIRASA